MPFTQRTDAPATAKEHFSPFFHPSSRCLLLLLSFSFLSFFFSFSSPRGNTSRGAQPTFLLPNLNVVRRNTSNWIPVPLATGTATFLWNVDRFHGKLDWPASRVTRRGQRYCGKFRDYDPRALIFFPRQLICRFLEALINIVSRIFLKCLLSRCEVMSLVVDRCVLLWKLLWIELISNFDDDYINRSI